MKTIVLSGKVVEMYDAISDLPVDRYHVYNKMLLIDSGIGSDLSDFDTHTERLRVYIQGGNREDAIKELNNLRQNVYMVQSGISPKMLAFAALVGKINGNECRDLSVEGLKKVVEEISGAAYDVVARELDDVKKK